jgi:hypothetical protein
MDLPRRMPTPTSAVSALASFVRERLADFGDSLAPILARLERAAADNDTEAMRAAARHAATVVVAAASPFATTSYARARLLRQLHASGLLTEREAAQGGPDDDVLGVAG